MSRLYALAASLAAVVALVSFVQGEDKDPPKKGKAHVVTMKDNEFSPKAITVAVGDTVIWQNKGEHEHNAVSSDDKGKAIDTGTVKPGEKSKAVLFSKKGKIKYECTFHDGMVGTITVK
jgi:plastocyanin